eukprot:2783862-Alexandrium_andersonii.AAC.1
MEQARMHGCPFWAALLVRGCTGSTPKRRLPHLPKLFQSFFSRSVQARAERRRKRLNSRLGKLEMRVYESESRLTKRIRTLERIEKEVQEAVVSGEIMWTGTYLKLRLKHLRAVNAIKDTRATIAMYKERVALFTPRLRQRLGRKMGVLESCRTRNHAGTERAKQQQAYEERG